MMNALAEPPLSLAPKLLGKLLCRRYADGVRRCQIIETEAYSLKDKASHAYRGRAGSESMFAAPGTIYMYRIRQWDSLNISALGKGCGVLIKAAIPYFNRLSDIRWLRPYGTPSHALGGQGLLCRALELKTTEWNGKQFCRQFYLADNDYRPQSILVTPRLGVTADQHLPYRFVDHAFAKYATLSHIKTQWRQQQRIKLCTSPQQATYFAANLPTFNQ